jgi:hypothetical protein
VKHLARWLWPALKVLFVVVLPFVPPSVVFAFGLPCWQKPWRNTFLVGGLLLQLAGFVTVWIPLTRSRDKHGQPTFWQRITAWRKSRRRNHVIAAGAGSFVIAGNGYLRARSDKGDYSPHARLTALEKDFTYLEHEVDGFREEMKGTLAALRTAVEEEAGKRETATEDLATRIHDTAVGSSDWQTVGLWWFVTGSLFSAIASWATT